MQKLLVASVNIVKHKDVYDIYKEIQRRELGFSRVIRMLLRNFRDNGYQLDFVDPAVDVDINSPDHPDFVEPEYKDEQGGGNSEPVI